MMLHQEILKKLSLLWSPNQPSYHIGVFDIFSLPQELIDRIIDHLHYDRPTLRSVSVAHRLLRPACLHHLVGTVTLSFEHSHLSSMKSTVQRSKSFPTHVRTLRLHGDVYGTLRVPDLTLLLQFQAVSSLYLRTVRFESASVWQQFLGGLSSLAHLRIEGWLGMPSDGLSVDASLNAPRLQSLLIHRSSHPQFTANGGGDSSQEGFDKSYANLVHWLGDTATRETLQTFSNRWMLADDLQTTQRFLDWETTTCPRECNIVLTGSYAEDFDVIYVPLLKVRPLSCATAISMISITLDARHNAIANAMELLAHTRIPSLQTIRITFTGYWSHGLRNFSGMNIREPLPGEPAFDATGFPMLQRIELVFQKVSKVSNARALMDRFSDAERRSVVVTLLPKEIADEDADGRLMH